MTQLTNVRNIKVGDIIALGIEYKDGSKITSTLTVKRVEEKSFYTGNTNNPKVSRHSYGTLEEWFKCRGLIGWCTITHI